MANTDEKKKGRGQRGPDKASTGKRSEARKVTTSINKNQQLALEHFFWSDPINLKDPDPTALIERVDEFREVYYQHNVLPTWSDLAVALGTNRTTLTLYRDGVRKCPENIRLILQRLNRWLEAIIVQFGISNPFSQSQAIFLQKNYFGFRDNIDINLGANQLTDHEQSAQDIMNRYKFIEASVITPELEEKPRPLMIEAQSQDVEVVDEME